MAARGPAQVFIKLIVMPGALSSAALPAQTTLVPTIREGDGDTAAVNIQTFSDFTVPRPRLHLFKGFELLLQPFSANVSDIIYFFSQANHLAFCMDLNGVFINE